jgi:hypothetical protein
MSAYTSTRIRLTDPSRVVCANCYTQDPDRRYVDFGAAYEGPVLPASVNVAGAIGVSVDDLVLSEGCLAEAAELVGLQDTTEGQRENERLERQCREAEDQLAAVLAHGEQLRACLRSARTLAEVGAETRRRSSRPRPKADG